MGNWKNRYGQWVVVTGASSGLGADFARQLAQKGMDIVLVARRKDRLNEVADEIMNDYNVQTKVIPVDLTLENAVDEVADSVSDLEVGMLVNNAGFGLVGYFGAQDEKRQANMVKLNCLAPVELAHKLIPQMVERGKGGIIFVASTAAFQATPFFSVYGATKGFNLLLGEALWCEYRKKGIDVLALCPGYTETEFQEVASISGGSGMSIAKSPAVVRTALKNLGRVPSVVHGKQNWTMSFIQRFVPRKSVIKLSGAVMKNMGREK
tara:strand:- start:16592 stop:17386 length:795 start_codon:yes stop_codon:yes gene_type:complete